MDREEFGVALLLSLPVAVGVALGVLKQTLGSQPIPAFVAGLTAGGLVFAVVAAAVRTDGEADDAGRLQPLADAIPDEFVPEDSQSEPIDVLAAAGVGAFVTLFLWYIPLSPLLGGAVAGFLGAGSMEEARAVGMLSGALVPVLGLVAALAAFLVAGATVFGQFPFGPVVAFLVAVVSVVYAVGLGRIGGWVGWKTFAEDAAWGAKV
jgi:hypothetical protein